MWSVMLSCTIVVRKKLTIILLGSRLGGDSASRTTLEGRLVVGLRRFARIALRAHSHGDELKAMRGLLAFAAALRSARRSRQAVRRLLRSCVADDTLHGFQPNIELNLKKDTKQRPAETN